MELNVHTHCAVDLEGRERVSGSSASKRTERRRGLTDGKEGKTQMTETRQPPNTSNMKTAPMVPLSGGARVALSSTAVQWSALAATVHAGTFSTPTTLSQPSTSVHKRVVSRGVEGRSVSISHSAAVGETPDLFPATTSRTQNCEGKKPQQHGVAPGLQARVIAAHSCGGKHCSKNSRFNNAGLPKHASSQAPGI